MIKRDMLHYHKVTKLFGGLEKSIIFALQKWSNSTTEFAVKSLELKNIELLNYSEISIIFAM